MAMGLLAALMFLLMAAAVVGGNDVAVDCSVPVIEIARNATSQWSNATAATYLYNCSVPREIHITVPELHNGTISLQTSTSFVRIVVAAVGSTTVNGSVSIVMTGLPCIAVNRTDSPVVVTGSRLRVFEIVLRNVVALEVRNVPIFAAVQSSPWEELRVALLNASLSLLEVEGFVSVTSTLLPRRTLCTVVNSTIVMSYIDTQFDSMNRYNYFLAPTVPWTNLSTVLKNTTLSLRRSMFMGYFGVNGSTSVVLERCNVTGLSRSFFIFSMTVISQLSLTLLYCTLTISSNNSPFLQAERGDGVPLLISEVDVRLISCRVVSSSRIVAVVPWSRPPFSVALPLEPSSIAAVVIFIQNSTVTIGEQGFLAALSFGLPISIHNVTFSVTNSTIVSNLTSASLVSLRYQGPHLNGSNRSVLLHPDILSNVSCTFDASDVDIGVESTALVYSSSSAMNVSIVLRNGSSVRLSSATSSLLYGEEGVLDSAVTVTSGSSVVITANDSSIVSVCGPSPSLSRLLSVSIAVTSGGSVALLGSSLSSWAFRRNTSNVPLLPLSSGVSLTLSNATIVVPLVGAALSPSSESGAQLSLSQAWVGDCVCAPNRTQCRQLLPLTDIAFFSPDVVVMPTSGMCGIAAPSCLLAAFQVVEAGSYVYDCDVQRPIEVYATGSGVFSITVVTPFVSVAVVGFGNASLASVLIAVVGGIRSADFRIASAGMLPWVVSVTGAPLLSFAVAIVNCTFSVENVSDFVVVSSAAVTVVVDVNNSTVTLLNVRAMIHLDTVVLHDTVLSITNGNVTVWQSDLTLIENWYTLIIGCFTNPLERIAVNVRYSLLMLMRAILLSSWAQMSNVSIALINSTITASTSILVYMPSTLYDVALIVTGATLRGGLVAFFVETQLNTTAVGIDGIRVYLTRSHVSMAVIFRVHSWATFNEALPPSHCNSIDNAVLAVSHSIVALSTPWSMMEVLMPKYGVGCIRNLTLAIVDSQMTCSGVRSYIMRVQTYALYGGISHVSIALRGTLLALVGGQSALVYSSGNASNVTVVMDGGTVAELRGSNSALAACAAPSEILCAVIGSTLSMVDGTSSVVRLIPSSALHRVDAVSLEVSGGSTIVMTSRSVAEPWLITLENISDSLALSPTSGSAVRLSQSRVLLLTGLIAPPLPPLLAPSSGGNVSVATTESCACLSPSNGSDITVCRSLNISGDFAGATHASIMDTALSERLRSSVFSVKSTDVRCFLTPSTSTSGSVVTSSSSAMSPSSGIASSSSSASPASTTVTVSLERPKVVQDATGAVVVQIVVNVITAPLALLSGAGVAMGAERAVLQLKLSVCEFSLENEVDISSSPTRLGIGSPQGQFVRGAVVGNFVLLLSVSALAVFAAWLTSLVLQLPLAEAMGLLSLPGQLVAPFAWLLQPTVSMATALALSQPAGAFDLAIGLVALVLSIVALCLIALQTTLRFGAVTVSETTPAPYRLCGAHCNILSWLYRREFEWVDAHPNDGFVARYGLLFEAYCGQRQWFVNIELLINAVVAVLVGAIPPGEGASCTSLLYGCVVANAAMCALHVVLRPHMSKLEIGVVRMQYALSFAWSVLALLPDDAAAQGASVVSQAQIWVSAVVLLMTMPWISASRRFKRLLQAWKLTSAAKEAQGTIQNDKVPREGSAVPDEPLALLTELCLELSLDDDATERDECAIPTSPHAVDAASLRQFVSISSRHYTSLSSPLSAEKVVLPWIPGRCAPLGLNDEIALICDD